MKDDYKKLEERIKKLEENQINVIMSYNADVNVRRALQRALIADTLAIGLSAPLKCALLQLSSNSAGLVLSRMTEVQRDLIEAPVAGLLILNTTTAKLNFWDGTAWAAITSV